MKYNIILASLWMLSSCQSNVLYSDTINIPDASWEDAQKISFEFDVEDSTTLYQLVARLKHNTDYAYENLYVNIRTVYSNGKIVEDPLSLEMADKSGQWYGACSGNTCTLDIMLQEKILFLPSGHYQIVFEPYMRVAPIVGIQSIGLTVQRVSEE